MSKNLLPARAAADGAGMPLSTIQSWNVVYRYDPQGDGSREKGGHRRYSPADVLQVAIAWRAVSHGAKVLDALSMADDVLKRQGLRVPGKPSSLSDAPAALEDQWLVAWTTEYKARVTIVSYRVTDGLSAPAPEGCRAKPEAFFVIDLAEVARGVIRRLTAEEVGAQ